MQDSEDGTIAENLSINNPELNELMDISSAVSKTNEQLVGMHATLSEVNKTLGFMTMLLLILVILGTVNLLSAVF